MPATITTAVTVRRVVCIAVLIGAVGLMASPAQTFRNPCDAAARRASRATGVPPAVLLAVTRVETGRVRDGRVEPWPWTVNVAGKGYWFDTAAAADTFAARQAARGAGNFDVGCFQINHRWHGGAFPSMAAMLDPDTNALYAAKFLSRLHREFGNWEEAAGAYHSRTAVFAERYKRKFREVHARLDPDVSDVAIAGAGDGNAAPGPLITGGAGTGRRAYGSLVVLPAAAGTVFLSLD